MADIYAWLISFFLLVALLVLVTYQVRPNQTLNNTFMSLSFSFSKIKIESKLQAILVPFIQNLCLCKV